MRQEPTGQLVLACPGTGLCFFHGRPGAGPCNGRLVRAHLIPKQLLAKEFPRGVPVNDEKVPHGGPLRRVTFQVVHEHPEVLTRGNTERSTRRGRCGWTGRI